MTKKDAPVKWGRYDIHTVYFFIIIATAFVSFLVGIGTGASLVEAVAR